MTASALLHDTAELEAVELAAPLRVVACAARTDRGTRRATNEDAILVAAPLLAVADGVGGNRAGEEASALALDVLRREVGAVADDAERQLLHAMHEANAAVREGRELAWREGMATTLVAALAGPSQLTVAHVGDSRAYLLRDGQLTPLTRDHTLVAALVSDGALSPDAAGRHPMRSVILRAIGMDSTLTPDVASVPAVAGDLLLLCSDGLTDALGDDDIARSATAEADLDRIVERLARAARAAGGGDDITVVAARLG